MVIICAHVHTCKVSGDIWTWLRYLSTGWIEEADCSELIDSEKISALVWYLENGNDVTIATDGNTMQAFMWCKTTVVVTATHTLQPSFPPSVVFPFFFPFLPSSLPTLPPSLFPFLSQSLPTSFPPSLWPLCIPLSSHFLSFLRTPLRDLYYSVPL